MSGSRPEPRELLVRRMPKVELHVHLEGSIQPATLLELATRRGVTLPASDEAGVRKWFEFRDFEHFIEIYLTCCRCLRDPEDFQLIAEEFLAEQERQNVLYSEVHFTIGTHLANGVNGDEVAEALYEVIRDAEHRRGIHMRLIPDIVRDVGPARADKTLGWTLEHRDRGIVALGLSGLESTPVEPYREHFRVAAAEGLHRVAHAGEHGGPDSIRLALDACDPERVGHGIAAVEDQPLMERLTESRIPLEVCPTSNVCLGAVSSLEEHPFDRLRKAGVLVTVNSDDPPFFSTTLTDEYLHLARVFDYSPTELAGFSWTALEHSFLSADEKSSLQDRFREQFAELGDELLGETLDPAGAEVVQTS